jgi:hypothetical protein
MLAHFVKHADLLDITTAAGVHEPPFRSIWVEDVKPELYINTSPPSRWLLIPITEKMLDQLAALEADLADLEEDDPAEDDGISAEPSLGASADLDQAQWASGATSGVFVDCEQDDSDDEDDGIDEHAVVRPDTMDRTGLPAD